jgi:hypothetical protein
MADPIFIVKFEHGLADRHRLPLAHVLSVLEEVRQMIVSVGRDIQRRHGIPEPTGDFGLELLAGRDGIVFKKGSVQAQVAITRDISNGIFAADSVLDTVHKLGRMRGPQIDLRLQDPVEQKIVRHLNRIASIQSSDKTELRLSLRHSNGTDRAKRPKQTSAVFGEAAIQMVKAAKLPAFTTDNLALYGRLFELRDRNQEQDSDRVWGELRLDNGEIWRVRFDSSRLNEIIPLFRKQVEIIGRAYYYEAYPPKIVLDKIRVDEDRDYEAAFDELFGSAKEQLGSDFDRLLKEMHGE